MKEISGFGTKANGEKVDIHSPEFRTEEYVSLTFQHEMTIEEAKKLYPLHFSK